MVKHTKTIHQQKPTNCLSVSDHFVGLALKGLWAFLNPIKPGVQKIVGHTLKRMKLSIFKVCLRELKKGN